MWLYNIRIIGAGFWRETLVTSENDAARVKDYWERRGMNVDIRRSSVMDDTFNIWAAPNNTQTEWKNPTYFHPDGQRRVVPQGYIKASRRHSRMRR